MCIRAYISQWNLSIKTTQGIRKYGIYVGRRASIRIVTFYLKIIHWKGHLGQVVFIQRYFTITECILDGSIVVT